MHIFPALNIAVIGADILAVFGKEILGAGVFLSCI